MSYDLKAAEIRRDLREQRLLRRPTPKFWKSRPESIREEDVLSNS